MTGAATIPDSSASIGGGVAANLPASLYGHNPVQLVTSSGTAYLLYSDADGSNHRSAIDVASSSSVKKGAGSPLLVTW